MRCTGERWLLPGMSPEHVVVHRTWQEMLLGEGGVLWFPGILGAGDMSHLPAVQVFLAR